MFLDWHLVIMMRVCVLCKKFRLYLLHLLSIIKNRVQTLLHNVTISNLTGLLFYDSLRKKGIFTIRNSSCGNVMFSQASVILSTGGGVSPRQTPHGQTSSPRRPLQQTVRSLLECILVCNATTGHRNHCKNELAKGDEIE